MKRLVGVLLVVGLSAPGVAVIVARPALATALPTITVGDSSVWEGDAGSVVVSVPVDLSAPSAAKVKVNYAVTSDSATAPGDFIAKTGTLTFSANMPSKPITVQVFGDTNLEPDEHVNITLSSPVNATLAKASGGVTILDDDHNGIGPGVEVNVGGVTVVEANAGKHVATIPVTLSRPVNTKIKVVYTHTCGSADGSDYTGKLKGTLTFAPYEQTKNITFYVLADLAPETTYESLFDDIKVTLGPAVVSQAGGGGTIVDNDGSGGSTIPPLDPGEIRRVSLANDGTEGESPAASCDSFMPVGAQNEALSANGRYVAFASDADNLVPGDSDLAIDTFVHDNVTGTTERVSVQNDGSEFPVDWYSVNPWQSGRYQPAISADGRFVTFLNSSDGQVYLRDRVAATTEMISVKTDGSPADDVPGSGVSSISADGRYVAFSSNSPGITSPAPPAGHTGLYVRDRVLGVTRLVNVYAQDHGGYYDWSGPVISADGRFVAFNDASSTIVTGDTNGCADTFVYDMTTGTTERVSVTSAGVEQSGGAACSLYRPVISGDGRYIGFTSYATNLYGAGASATAAMHSYIRDRVAGTTTLVDDATLNPAEDSSIFLGLSDDGNDVAWACLSFCGDPVADTSGPMPDHVSMYTDRAAGTTREIGVPADGTPPIQEDTGGFTWTMAWGGLSADGSMVAFDSRATNLVADDANGVTDVFVERMY